MTDIVVSQQTVQVRVSQEGRPAVLVSVPARPQVVVKPVGSQGPPGPTSDVVTELAASAVSALRAVHVGASGVAHVDPSSLSEMATVFGVSLNAAAAAGNVAVRRSGLMQDGSWSWTAGLPIFIGANGALTQTAPSSVAVRSVAVATSATEILVEISDLILME